MRPEELKGKSDDELVLLMANSDAGSRNTNKAQAEFIRRGIDAINNLTNQLTKNQETSNKLAKGLYWLNWMIALGTLTLAIVAVLQFIEAFYER